MENYDYGTILGIFSINDNKAILKKKSYTLKILNLWFNTITGTEYEGYNLRKTIVENIRSAIKQLQTRESSGGSGGGMFPASPYRGSASSAGGGGFPSRASSGYDNLSDLTVSPNPSQNYEPKSGGGAWDDESVFSTGSTSSFRSQIYQIPFGTIEQMTMHLTDRNRIETGETDDSSVALFLNFALNADTNGNEQELQEDLNNAIENMYSRIEELCDESVDNADATSTADWLEPWSEPRDFDKLVAVAIEEFNADADVVSVQIIDENGSVTETNLQQLPFVEIAKSPEVIKQIIKNRRKITYSCYGEKNDISLPFFLWRFATKEQIEEYFTLQTSPGIKFQITHDLAQIMLTKNSKFAALKFACANKVPILIPNKNPPEKSNASIYYFSQEILWILQDTPEEERIPENTKFMWRSKRFELLSLFSRCPAAIQLFENVYHKLCSVVGNVKISSVGGNPIRAFCLVMNCYFNGIPCNELTQEIIAGLNTGLYSEDEINYLRITTKELCDKLSDTDGIGIELFDASITDDLTQAETQLAKDVLEYSLESHCSGNNQFTGENDFILIRSKANTLIDEMSPRLMACYADGKPIQNKAETLKLAKTDFLEINWFPQMISSAEFPHTYESVSDLMTKEIYDEIVKLYRVLQTLKSINADLTQLVSSIISNNSTNPNENYEALRQYTGELCTTVSHNIGPLPRGFSQDIKVLASQSPKVLQSYSEMFGLGNNESPHYATTVNNRILHELPGQFPILEIMPATYALKGKYKGGIRKPHSMALVVPGEDKDVNNILFESVKPSNLGFKSLLSDDMNKSNQSYTLNRLRFGGPIEDIGDDGDDNRSVNALDAASVDANKNLELSGGSKRHKTRKRKHRKTRKRGKPKHRTTRVARR